jgi:hypothetical protein
MSDPMTIKEAATFIGITPKAVYLAIEEERITPVKLLGKLGVSSDEAKRFKRQRNGYKKSNGNGHK